jgi:hypothetical protein
VGCWTLTLVVAAGCGGSVAHGSGDGDEAGSSFGGSSSGQAGTSSGGTRAGSGGSRNLGGSAGTPSAAGTGGTREPDPVDTGCPPEDLPPPELACDPFTPDSCGIGLGCYPFVDHPLGSGCDQQRYGTVCGPVGVGHQGESCGDDTGDWCDSGYVCVVGQRAGKRCAKLCQLGVANQCSGGLLCGDLDVAGFGVCG